MATSEANMATSEANKATSEANMATSEANVASLIRKKLKKEELHFLILNNCTDWISMEDLSLKINRSEKYLRNVVIPVLIASKKLQMLYPGTPNHPNQKYKVSE